jgi:drug/metabolite transporter (DMT)-like permease
MPSRPSTAASALGQATESRARPALSLMLNAALWGLAWWPMRRLEAQGLHPLWATALAFGGVALAIAMARPQALRDLLQKRTLWAIAFAAGITNACFNWGVTSGDVVRVVLLFYLMPVWTIVLARVFLHEAIDAGALMRLALGLAGTACVLWPDSPRGPWLQLQWPDLLGIASGLSCAANNIVMRRTRELGDAARGLAMFVGGGLVALLLACVLPVPTPPKASPEWIGLTLGLGCCYLCSNLAFQYGVSRLPANRTAVIMLTEIVWAAASAVLLGAGVVTPQLALGGSLILGAAALAALGP